MALKDMEPLLFEGIYNNLDWPTQLELMAASLGYVVIANSSIETIEIKDRVYVIYLPSNPNNYQLQELRKINPEFKQTNIDVSVEGNLKEAFLRERLTLNNNFIPQKFLDDYISNNLYILKKEPKKVT